MIPSFLTTQAWIDGTLQSGGSADTFPVHNPADASLLAIVADCNRTTAKAATDAAASAFPVWRALVAKDRARHLQNCYAALLRVQDDLARLMSLEQGKPLTEARGEVSYAAAYFEWFAEEAKRTYGDVIPETSTGRKIITLKEPVGVVAAITPWNFPLAMLARKVAPALAAGCTVVSKPAEDTPLTALAFARICSEAGLPTGVFNVVPASRDHAAEVADAWLNDDRIRKLSFTGSTTVGQHLAARSTATLKRVSLELGGNAPFIVFDDADLSAAVRGAIQAKFRNAGQTCVCANRILVQAGIYDRFAAALVDAVAKLKVGEAFTDGAEIGPLINRKAMDKVTDFVEDAKTQGARILLGGKPHPAGDLFFSPTVLANVTPAMRCSCEEIFGPVAPLLRFETEEEAITLANSTPFGLAAYFYTQDQRRTWRLASALEAGMIGINEGIISTEVAPFGGIKHSGYGREGSRYGIEEYQQIKYICLGGLS